MITMCNVQQTNKRSEIFNCILTDLYGNKMQNSFKPAEEDLIDCFVIRKKGKTAARFALYCNAAMLHNGKKTVSIGSYECIDDASVANEMLAFASSKAKELGAQYLIGPLDGSTWNSYRFNLHNEGGNYFLEPKHKNYYIHQFRDFGFNPLAEYHTYKSSYINHDAEFLNEYNQFLKKKKAKVRNISMDNFEEDLFKIASFCNEAFKDNFLFTKTPTENFVNQYKRLKAILNPNFIFIIENAFHEIEAISFSIPNLTSVHSKSFIIKTLARRKESPLKGSGKFLIHKTYEMARQQNFTEVFHAFIKSGNASKKISETFKGDIFQTYQLLYKEL